MRDNVNLPAGQSCGKTDVLSLVADGKRKLIVGNDNVTALRYVRVNGDRSYLCRSKRGGNIFFGLLAVTDNVDLLSAKSVNNAVDTLTAGTDAGTDGVNIFITASDGNFGSGAGFS